MTPAEELRTAATKLRDAAVSPLEHIDPLVEGELDEWTKYYGRDCPDLIEGDGPWLVLMTPKLAEPLAAWLDSEANRKHITSAHLYRGVLGGFSGYCSCGNSVVRPDPEVPAECGRLNHALAVARVINGGAS